MNRLGFFIIFTFMILSAREGSAAVGGMSIGGCIYTGDGSVVYAPVGPEIGAARYTKYVSLVDPVSNIVDAHVIAQEQHSDVAMDSYDTIGLGIAGNFWEFIILDNVVARTPMCAMA